MKILVIALAGIGDSLLATPLIHELRLLFPEARLEALVLWAGARDLLENNPSLDAIHQHNFLELSRAATLQRLWALRAHRYDVALITHPQARIHYRVAAGLIGAPRRLSHVYDRWTALDRWLVTETLPQDYSVHSVENNLRLLPLLGQKPQLPRHKLEVFLTPTDTDWAERYLRSPELAGRRRLGIHIGSGGTKNLRLKRWPSNHYAELIGRLTREHPEFAILLFGGPGEAAEQQQILQQNVNRPVFAPETRSLRQAAALLARCDAFLSVDTALMHLAAAVQVPQQIVIEAPTLNVTNLPYRSQYHLVRNPAIQGRNLEFYRYDGGPIRGSKAELQRCMASVSVDAVFAAVTQALR